MFDRSHRILFPAIWLAMGVLAAALPSDAQYPGHIDTAKKSAPMPRAIAVVEWTGAEGKPKASRIIPIAVYDGETYQPGGLYLARPAPLAVETGTEYILQVAGIPQGLFDVQTAQDVEGYWLGYGTWKSLAPAPRPHKLAPSKLAPQVVGREDNRPHFKTGSGSAPAGTPSGGTASAPSSTTQPDPPSQSDPDRPTLRRRTAAAAEDAKAAAISTPSETIVGGPDPDRPHIAHGSAHPTDPGFEASKLEGAPSNLQQMIAVSDAIDREPHPYTYAWADPGDAAKMQVQMETLAQKALAPPPAATKPAATKSATTRRATTARPAAHGHVAAKTTTKAAAAPPALTGVGFHAFQLTYDSGATLVLSAESTDAAGNVRYITLIGQPDFYGAVHVIFQSITDDAHLDETPKMLLVDAVDPKADDRGDLVFELRGRHDRQFAIYRVGTGQVEQVFTTGSLSLTPSPTAPDSPDS